MKKMIGTDTRDLMGPGSNPRTVTKYIFQKFEKKNLDSNMRKHIPKFESS